MDWGLIHLGRPVTSESWLDMEGTAESKLREPSCSVQHYSWCLLSFFFFFET